MTKKELERIDKLLLRIGNINNDFNKNRGYKAIIKDYITEIFGITGKEGLVVNKKQETNKYEI